MIVSFRLACVTVAIAGIGRRRSGSWPRNSLTAPGCGGGRGRAWRRRISRGYRA
jgi:hypothetical protein